MKIISKIMFSLKIRNDTLVHSIPKPLRFLCQQTKYYSCNRKHPKKKLKQNLLKFPALKLEETLPKYLKTVKPLLTSEEYEETVCRAKAFAEGDGAKLQKLLEEVARKEDNWLAHRWLKVAYLGYRDPVTVYSSPAMTFPITKFKNEDDFFMYTAKVIISLLKFKKIADDGKMPIQTMGKNELDNSQFGKVFGTCRIPKEGIDGLEYNPDSDYVVVLHKNYFYKLPVYNKEGELLNADVLFRQLKDITACAKDFGPPIGLLSIDHRDKWAKAYAKLIECRKNCQNVKIIQKCLFTVSLDQRVPFDECNKFNVLGTQLVHGGGSKQNSANRWMDKTIQVIVNPNGMSGFCYEHSPAEGQPIAMMTDYVTKIFPKESEFKDGASNSYECFSTIELDPNGMGNFFRTSQKTADDLANDMHLYVKLYTTYGKEFLKQQKLSPDSYIQTALQFAFYKLHKYPTAQYESAHLRIYYGGRTETIRSCSIEAVAFARAMLDPQGCDANRALLLREAVKGHRNYTTMALQGRGVDRHLLGLKLMAIENNLPIPSFFSSKAFVKSSHFRLSTSQVATGNEAFMCYGCPVKDGYGCCYNPRKKDMFLACSSWRSNEETDSECYAKCLGDALDQMQTLLKKSN